MKITIVKISKFLTTIFCLIIIGAEIAYGAGYYSIDSEPINLYADETDLFLTGEAKLLYNPCNLRYKITVNIGTPTDTGIWINVIPIIKIFLGY